MYTRKIDQFLKEFKTKNEKKAIVIKGPRQVGKTTTALNYAKKFYKNVVYLNFMDTPSLKKIFEGDLNVDKIIRTLSAYFPTINFEPYKTILVFDEVQECANARYSLKPFVIDGRFDVISTGSLLGIKGYNLNHDLKIPVGYESTFYMSSLDFEEYLLAKGINYNVIDYLKECLNNLTPIDEALHTKMLELFNEYIIVGGMPNVITNFIKNNSFSEVRKVQKDILESYKDDFGKHLKENETKYVNKYELTRILDVYNSIPFQLAKENKKFQYNQIKTGARSKDYQDAINFLCDLGLAKKAYNLASLEPPLPAYKIDSEFKIYMFDTGLLVSMMDDYTAKDILEGTLGIYKGAIFENIIADILSKNDISLYYYHKNNSLELDFVVRYKNEILPLEIKASSGNAKSLKTILTNKEKYKINYGIKLTKQNIGFTNNVLTIPYYLISFLKFNKE